jgi:hypothetical protein
VTDAEIDPADLAELHQHVIDIDIAPLA